MKYETLLVPSIADEDTMIKILAFTSLEPLGGCWFQRISEKDGAAATLLVLTDHS